LNVVVTRRAMLALLQIALTLVLVAQTPAYAKVTDEEKKLGQEAAEQIAKQYKFVTDPKLVERVQRVGKAVAAAALQDEPDLDFTFTIVDDNDVNAFSLPGGRIYVNKGLLDKVQSDDELAGVLAHECAHAARHHVMSLIKESEKLSLPRLAAVLVVIATQNQAAADTAQVFDWIAQAKVSGYSVKLEMEADRVGLEYLMKTPYNPVGELTFMERLADEEYWRPQIDWGIYRTHPLSEERAQALIKELKAKGIPIDRRHVLPSRQVQVRDVQIQGTQAAELVMAGRQLAVLGGDGAVTARDRAVAVAKVINAALDNNPRPTDVIDSRNAPTVTILGQPVFTATAADAAVNGKSPQEVAASLSKALRVALFAEQLKSPIVRE